VGKGKLTKFEEVRSFENVLEPDLEELFQGGHELRGRWKDSFFSHAGPLYLELACGKGEYSVELARRYPDSNFLGIDIKGNRIWTGAKQALEEGLDNVRFLRTRVEFVDAFFGRDEVDGIWFTFPDPQTKKKRAKKRLTAPAFLEKYRGFLKPDGKLHLKTDNDTLYRFTQEVLQDGEYPVERDLSDVHASIEGLDEEEQEWMRIRTFYEEMAIQEGSSIKYIRFRLR
jgi:tRNA (guanine-N7-)-methyltransferase